MGVRNRVVAAVVEVCGSDPEVLADDATLDTLGIDSLDLLEIAVAVEQEFDVEVDAEAFEGVRTFGQAVAVFERMVAASSE